MFVSIQQAHTPPLLCHMVGIRAVHLDSWYHSMLSILGILKYFMLSKVIGTGCTMQWAENHCRCFN